MTSELKQIITEQIKKHPNLELKDLLKLLYQNEFGPQHLAKNELESFKSLSKELQTIDYDPCEPLFEDIGSNALRLNLKALPRETNINYINKIIVKSNEYFHGTNEKLVVKFGLLVVMAENNEIPFPIQQVRDETNSFAKNGFKPISHSDIYKESYSPSYRVISKRFKQLTEAVISLSPILKNDRKLVISIDGNAASGKTTLSEDLASLLNGEIVHCDDFFLPQNMRNAERLNAPGGNIHYERLNDEVITLLKKPHIISYKAYDCGTDTFKESRFLLNKNIVIVEGAYSSHPYLGNYSDFKIFLKADENLQKERILKRNGEAMLSRFLNEWIPMENKYFKEFKTEENSDLIIRSV